MLLFAFFSFGQARRALRRMMPCLLAGLFESTRLIRFSSGAISRNHFFMRHCVSGRQGRAARSRFSRKAGQKRGAAALQ